MAVSFSRYHLHETAKWLFLAFSALENRTAGLTASPAISISKDRFCGFGTQSSSGWLWRCLGTVALPFVLIPHFEHEV
jgi:hypothetical protein